jgi:hypothetical protein
LNAANPTAENAAAPRNAAFFAWLAMLEVSDLPAESPNRRPPFDPAALNGPDVPEVSFDSKPRMLGTIWSAA